MIVLRKDKTEPLTREELDNNFLEISNKVSLTGNETISGVKTFSSGIVQTPSTSASPTSNGQMVFELTSNTSLTIKVKGSDGVVRSAVITLN